MRNMSSLQRGLLETELQKTKHILDILYMARCRGNSTILLMGIDAYIKKSNTGVMFLCDTIQTGVNLTRRIKSTLDLKEPRGKEWVKNLTLDSMGVVLDFHRLPMVIDHTAIIKLLREQIDTYGKILRLDSPEDFIYASPGTLRVLGRRFLLLVRRTKRSILRRLRASKDSSDYRYK